MGNPLIVKRGDLESIQHWPIELRALFDPQADRELATKIQEEKRRRAPAGMSVCPHPEDYREGMNCALCNDSGFIPAEEEPILF